MRTPKPEWVAALRRLEGCADAEIRFNPTAYRWEFVLPGADGVPRSQFFGWFNQKVDPTTGMYPFRELDDVAMREVLGNLERTYVGNRHDGAGTTRKEVEQRYRFNQEKAAKGWKAMGEAFADMAAERGKRLRGALQLTVPIHLGR